MLRSLSSGLLLRHPSSSCYMLHHHHQLHRPLHAISQTHRTADGYFAAVHHIANVVRRDFYLERTLNRLRLPPPTPDFVLRVIRACSSTHPLPALRFFSWCRSSFPSSYRPSSLEFESLVLSLARSRLWSQLWRLLREMHESLTLPLSPSIFSSLITSYGEAGLVDGAVDVFNRAPAFSVPQTTDVYNALLAALCRARNFQGAYALVRRMARKAVTPDRRTFSLLVDGWCAAGKLKEAHEFLEEMARLYGFRPPVRGRDLLIDGLIGAGYLESAKALVLRMTKEGLLPDVTTLNSLLEALAAKNPSEDIEFSVNLLHDASILGLCPDISTYKILIPAAARAGRIEDAFRLLHSCMDDGHKPFPSLYGALVKALCKAGRFGDAMSFFSDMKVRGHPPHRPAYTMLVKMCVRGGRYVEAANYLVEMTEMGLMPRAQSFDMVVDGLKHCGKHDLARKIEQLEEELRKRVMSAYVEDFREEGQDQDGNDALVEHLDSFDIVDQGRTEGAEEIDSLLVKCLIKQRQRAVAASRGAAPRCSSRTSEPMKDGE